MKDSKRKKKESGNKWVFTSTILFTYFMWEKNEYQFAKAEVFSCVASSKYSEIQNTIWGNKQFSGCVI